MASKPTSQETEHLRTYLCHPKIKDPLEKVMRLSNGIGTRSWIAMMSTSENLPEHLG